MYAMVSFGGGDFTGAGSKASLEYGHINPGIASGSRQVCFSAAARLLGHYGISLGAGTISYHFDNEDITLQLQRQYPDLYINIYGSESRNLGTVYSYGLYYNTEFKNGFNLDIEAQLAHSDFQRGGFLAVGSDEKSFPAPRGFYNYVTEEPLLINLNSNLFKHHLSSAVNLQLRKNIGHFSAALRASFFYIPMIVDNTQIIDSRRPETITVQKQRYNLLYIGLNGGLGFNF
jgi:hypothetical protein